MSDNTCIEWCDATWNPVTGCTEVSSGCDHCYAKTFAERWRGTPGHYFERGFDVQLRPDKLDQPLRWRRPRRIFVNSMSDLFHDQVPDEYIAQVFAVMAAAPRHTFQVLTKRHARMRSLMRTYQFWQSVSSHFVQYTGTVSPQWMRDGEPLPNVWLGVSTENQQWADIRIPALLDTPAAVRFISAEPLLGPIDLARFLEDDIAKFDVPALDWVIVGGESGPGARPMHSSWPYELVKQCLDAKVPLLFKQWGNWVSDTDLIRELGYDPMKPHALVAEVDGRVVKSADDIDGRGGAWMHVWNVGKKKAGRRLLCRTWDQYPVVANA